jgi:hypothetical protein
MILPDGAGVSSQLERDHPFDKTKGSVPTDLE